MSISFANFYPDLIIIKMTEQREETKAKTPLVSQSMKEDGIVCSANVKEGGEEDSLNLINYVSP